MAVDNLSSAETINISSEGTKDSLTHTTACSHVLQDGTFVHLPDLTESEHAQFLERSIAKHGFLRPDLSSQRKQDESDDQENKKEEDAVKRIHPLAVASARLNAKGVSELSKAINLSGLVSCDEYFGLSNIVNPLLEIPTKGGSAKAVSSEIASSKAVGGQEENEAQLRAALIGKRKRAQFVSSTEFLEKQQHRLSASALSQSAKDKRLLELRNRWRLVAPEHGTRAKPHAARPTEIVAIDVDVYDRDRTRGSDESGKGGISTTANGTSLDHVQSSVSCRVPRFAVVELKDDFIVDSDQKEKWQEGHANVVPNTKIDNCVTFAEPFAVANPTLGKNGAEISQEPAPMLTLQLAIVNDNTTFRQSACLSPLVFEQEELVPDEKVVVELQHSLFCASLFDLIRHELVDIVGLSSTSKATHQISWLSSEAEENFLPSLCHMVGGRGGHGAGAGALCIVHCHEGEVKVRLDSEYSMSIKLVEATAENENDIEMKENTQDEAVRSGSQKPEQLHVLCHTLLVHMQHAYHKHSIKARSLEALESKRSKPVGLERIAGKKALAPPPRILHQGVMLGAKLLFEQQVRRAIKSVKKWIKTCLRSDADLRVVWLALSVFDLRSHFTLTFQDLCMDIRIDGDSMNVTSGEEAFESVDFHGGFDFEMFLKIQIRKRYNSN